MSSRVSAGVTPPAYRREAAPLVCGYRNKANYERHIVLRIGAKQAA
jgi:hypothetical protein